MAAREIHNDVQVSSSEDGLPLLDDWQRYPSSLQLIVGGGGVHCMYDSAEESQSEPLPFPATKSTIADPISKLLEALNGFRDAHSDYLDDFDGDFESRLASYVPSKWPAGSMNSPLPGHVEHWDQVATSEELRLLAVRGYLLFDEVFPTTSPILRKRLEELEPGSYLDVFWTDDSASHIPNLPWPLLYIVDPDSAGEVDPAKFFGLRFRLSYKPYAISARRKCLGGCDSMYGHAFYWSGEDPDPALEEANWQRSIWDPEKRHVHKPSRGAAAPREEVRDFLRETDSCPMPVVYLFCKCRINDSKEASLYFGDPPDDSVTICETDLPRDDFKGEPLVFCNACSSAEAVGPYSTNPLERHFFKRSCSAFLGTLEKTPVRLASKFAAAFFQFFRYGIQGRRVSAGEAVTQARLFLWETYNNVGGLFYTYLHEYNLFVESTETGAEEE